MRIEFFPYGTQGEFLGGLLSKNWLGPDLLLPSFFLHMTAQSEFIVIGTTKDNLTSLLFFWYTTLDLIKLFCCPRRQLILLVYFKWVIALEGFHDLDPCFLLHKSEQSRERGWSQDIHRVEDLITLSEGSGEGKNVIYLSIYLFIWIYNLPFPPKHGVQRRGTSGLHEDYINTYCTFKITETIKIFLYKTINLSIKLATTSSH